VFARPPQVDEVGFLARFELGLLRGVGNAAVTSRNAGELTCLDCRPESQDHFGIELVEQNYDQMIKYATAIRQGTASTEAILRRFTRSASHPTYQAMLEVGRAQRTIFVARYLRRRELQREITEGLNIVEAFNGANSVIYYGKGGEIASNRHDEQEMTVLCLRILQAALVYVNTLLLQDVLAEADWSDLLTVEDRRGLTPLFWQHVLPYGR